MTKFIERVGEESDIEVAGYDTIVELYKIQHETIKEGLEAFSTLASTFLTVLNEDNKASRSNELRRIKLEESRLKFEKEQSKRYDLAQKRSARKCFTTKDKSRLSKKALAAKGSVDSKFETEAGGTKG